MPSPNPLAGVKDSEQSIIPNISFPTCFSLFLVIARLHPTYSCQMTEILRCRRVDELAGREANNLKTSSLEDVNRKTSPIVDHFMLGRTASDCSSSDLEKARKAAQRLILGNVSTSSAKTLNRVRTNGGSTPILVKRALGGNKKWVSNGSSSFRALQIPTE